MSGLSLMIQRFVTRGRAKSNHARQQDTEQLDFEYPQKIADVVSRAKDWLFRNQDQSGGWGPWVGAHPSALNTSEVVLSLLESGSVSPADPHIQKAVDFLIRNRCTKGEDTGAWKRGADKGRFLPDIARTSFAVQALLQAGRSAEEPAVKEALSWIQTQQLVEGGWSFSQARQQPDFMATAFALLALLGGLAAGGEGHKNSIQKGLDFLVNEFNNANGSFGNKAQFIAVHTIYAVLVLRSASRVRFKGDYERVERAAMSWILHNISAIDPLVEEKFTIEPLPGGAGNYVFSYVTEALLLQVLRDSPDSDALLQTTSATRLLLKLRTQIAPEGGFCSDRASSWATARAITTLGKFPLKEFPKTKGEIKAAQNERVGKVFLALAFTSIGTMIYLSGIGHFGYLEASVLGFLVLCLLVIYGVITGVEFMTILTKFSSKG